MHVLAPEGPEVAPRSAWADTRRWDAEYGQLRSIPSSLRLRPSRAFRRLERTMALRPGAVVLDAGAGTGRHSLHLAARGCVVHAVDTSGVACTVLRERVAQRPDLAGSLRVEQATLAVSSVPDERYDVILDSYVSCHLLDDDERLAYLESLLRQLRPGGHLYTACMGADDGYYRPLATGAAPHALATDPLNGITKLLQPSTAFGVDLVQVAPLVATTAETFTDRVAGAPYERQVLAAVLQRR